MQYVQVYPGFSQNILQALKLKVDSMPPKSRLVSVVLDEMSIKEAVVYNRERDEVEGLEDFGTCGRSQYVANYALAFMVKGIVSDWKQPVGYFLSSGPTETKMLHTLLLECIDKVTEIGLNVKLVVADQGSNNRSMFQTHLKVTEENPRFVHNGNEVYVMYDPPHLLKSIRNNLKNTGFSIDGQEVKWDHIEEFYRFDRINQVHIAPRLTEKHVSLPAFSNMKVSLAARVLSHSVAAGVSTLVSIGVLPPCATPTFLDRFDQLFNAFNSRTLTSTRPMEHALTATSGHKEFLLDCLQWLEKVKPCSGRSLPCLSGWKLSIRALLALWEDVHVNHDIAFLLSDKLNQDCIENLFSRIRGKGGHLDNPTAQQFRFFFRQIMVDAFFIHSDGSNCHNDASLFLLTLASLNQLEQQQQAPPASAISGSDRSDRALQSDQQQAEANHDQELAEEISDLFEIAVPQPLPKHTAVQLAEKNVLTYIAGYMAKKLKMKVCMHCYSLLTGSPTGCISELLTVNKQYTTATSGLVFPSQQLRETVEVLEGTYLKLIDRVLYMDKIKARLTRALLEAVKDRFEQGQSHLACPRGTCNLNSLIKDLFLSIRIHFTLKLNTQSFSEKSSKAGKRNRKMMKLCHL